MKLIIAAAGFCGVLLTGCISSGGADVIKPIASEVSVNARVDEVRLMSKPDGVDPQFESQFTQALKSKVATCAKGTRPLRLEVTVQDFHASGGFKTWMIGDANHVRGSAKLIDSASGEMVADYDVNRSVGGGGLIAAMAMSEPDQEMGEAFGDEVCKQAFIRR